MALIKCKECRKEVSNKAKKCPNCGAKVPKKTSLFTWLVLAGILFIVYAVAQGPTTTTTTVKTFNSDKDSSGSASATSGNSNKVTTYKTPEPTWTTSTSKDQMTGESNVYASSPSVFSKNEMSFPYHDVKSWMGVGCSRNSVWAYFGFTKAPNLNNAETKDGYNLIKTRIKFDEKVDTATLIQEWGDKFLHFKYDNFALKNISAANKVLLELSWHGSSPAYFEYTLNGSADAIADIRDKCAK